MKNDMKSQIMKQKATIGFLLVGGIIITVLAGFCAVACLVAGLIPAAVFFFIFAVIGVLFIKNSNTRKKMIAEYKQYVAVLSQDPTHSISNLAKTVGKDEEALKKRINQMIVMGLFADAFVDENTNTVMLGVQRNHSTYRTVPNGTVSINVTVNGAENTTAATAASNEPEYVVVQCEGCGAKAKIKKGDVGVCEYCGSPLGNK